MGHCGNVPAAGLQNHTNSRYFFPSHQLSGAGTALYKRSATPIGTIALGCHHCPALLHGRAADDRSGPREWELCSLVSHSLDRSVWRLYCEQS